MLFRATALVSFLLTLPAYISAEITPSDGCSAEKILIKDLEPGAVSRGFSVNGRSVRVTLPKSYKPGKPSPMVLAYHDSLSSPRRMEADTGLSDEDINEDTIVVYLAGVDKKWQGQPDAPENVDDFAFTESLLDRLSSKLCIDTSRIYAAGHGTGGGMVHLLACNPVISTRIAAFAAVNGAFYESVPQSNIWNLTMCQPGRPQIPMFEIHGGSNGVYDYWGDTPAGGNRAPIVKWFVEWAMRNGCGKPVSNPKVEGAEGYTVLERGEINESRMFNGRVVKAAYRCWHGGEKREMEESIEEMYVRFMKERKAQGLPTEDDQVLDKLTEVLDGMKSENVTETDDMVTIAEVLEEIKADEAEKKNDAGASSKKGDDKKTDKETEKSVKEDNDKEPKNEDVKEEAKEAGKAQGTESSIEDIELTEKEKATVKEAKEKKIKEIRARNALLKTKGNLVAAHYMLQGVGNNWPRVDMKFMAPRGYSNATGADDGDMYFDATPLVLGWFKLHSLTPQSKEELEDLANKAGREFMMEAGKLAAKKQAEETGEDIKDTPLGKDLPDGVRILGADKGMDEALQMEVNEAIKKLVEELDAEEAEKKAAQKQDAEKQDAEKPDAEEEDSKKERTRDEL